VSSASLRPLSLDRIYRLANKARLRWDRVRASHVLVYPERGLLLNESAVALLEAFDGRTPLASALQQVARELGAPYERLEQDVRPFLQELLARGLLTEVQS
jgi:pyrroloquinoline quinone biosynthesis protein D